jgi:hypothetical protein
VLLLKPENRPQSVENWLKLLGLEVVSRIYSASPNRTNLFPVILSLKSDYYKLRDLLADENWRGANIETSNLMLALGCPTKGRWLDSESIKKISCEEFRIIDRLWINYSNGKFGFSIQHTIWDNVQGNVDQFGNLVGWRVKRSWIQYSKYNFNIHAPHGHLPAYLEFLGFVWKDGWFGDYWDGDLSRVKTLVSKWEQCNI